ncbi:MAG: hypothetical protein A3I61_05225 [Acidobacteria bacterium RIFCSPLOWO2_02_FULL_68_18]|nr:MAG: hypothetical protein A3I61_05225 [Acidobacteria bacterium RIFCSPLOWO2_02_FULL_68_18]OFW49302.1 MAG: hypothetical protein A3G77_04025 [Acidobacteria bacterium RIFCSPLOWO2_12_FULL_68_19]
MIRLHIVVEGQTEETFVNEVLAPELGAHNTFTDAHRITTGRKHGRTHRGGWDSYQKLQRDLVLWMKQDQDADARFTTMVDLYALPGDFPGYAECGRIAVPIQRAECLERHLVDDIIRELGNAVARCLVPYIQLHEFETFVFCEPAKLLVAFPAETGAVHRLDVIRQQFAGPEDIDDGKTSAPSKRILEVIPEYTKAVAGPLIVKQIGLPRLRNDCPHFDSWITRLIELDPP